MGRLRKDGDGTIVQSVSRAISLLEILSRETKDTTISKLAKKSGLNITTAHRLLNTLMSHGFVEQDKITLQYRLGIKAFEIGHAALSIRDLVSTVRPFLKQLSDQVNETINLAVLDGTEVVYIDQIESSNIIIVKMFARVGSRGPAYCTGTGKVLLADLDHDELLKRFSDVDFIQFTDKTISNLNQLIPVLEQIRNDGYALDYSERDPGVTCAAAPVRNAEGHVQAAISISAPAHRMSEERINTEILPILLDTTAMASRQLGYISNTTLNRK